METAPYDLTPLELLCLRRPALPYGARVVWELCRAELERSGRLPRVDDLAGYLGCARRTVQQHLTNLYKSGELTRGSYYYLRSVDRTLRLAEAMPYADGVSTTERKAP